MYFWGEGKPTSAILCNMCGLPYSRIFNDFSVFLGLRKWSQWLSPSFLVSICLLIHLYVPQLLVSLAWLLSLLLPYPHLKCHCTKYRCLVVYRIDGKDRRAKQPCQINHDELFAERQVTSADCHAAQQVLKQRTVWNTQRDQQKVGFTSAWKSCVACVLMK